MKKYGSLTIIPDYRVDEFVVYTLQLPNLVTYGPTDPLYVHGARTHSNPTEMEIVGFDEPMTAEQIADAMDAEGYRPADYGELRGYWNDNVPDETVVIIPSKEDMASGVSFNKDGTPQALVITKPPRATEALFATIPLTGPMSKRLRFLITKK